MDLDDQAQPNTHPPNTTHATAIDALAADGSPEYHRRDTEAQVFGAYAALIRRLRAADGCPWDRKQTLQSLRRYLIEESFELVAEINEVEQSQSSAREQRDSVAEELGDVLLVTLLLSDALEQEHNVTLSSVLLENGKKLIRRHPHVFGDVTVGSTDEVVANWNEIKRTTEGKSDTPIDVSRGLPPLERAREIQKKAAKFGFDWDSIEPVLDKIQEELDELREAVLHARTTERSHPAVEEELGDVLFSVVNAARHVKVDPSIALAGTNEKFLSRFAHMESLHATRYSGEPLTQRTLKELDELWSLAKQAEAETKNVDARE
jgi:tetrapyrrole methylase family protein/MazG family protein